MAATIDATLQGASSNSYVTLAEADAYFETTAASTQWDNKNTDKKNRALISATCYIDGFEFYGTRCTTTQALKWPRKDYKVDGVEIKCTFIPDDGKMATFELARALANDPDALVGTKGTDGPYEEVKLGDLEVKYSTQTQTSGLVNNILDIYPWLQSMLGLYTRSGATNYSVTLLRG